MASSGRRAERKLTAATADKHRLYQWAVQSPVEDIEFAVSVYRSRRRRAPRHFREDFCGTAYLTAAWLRRGAQVTAEAVDLDPEPLAWGKRHNFGRLGASARERVIFHQADVREPSQRRPDVRCAQNFSWFVFKSRAELLEYFGGVYSDLAPGGLFLLDIFGGPQAIEETCEESECRQGFTYVWEQRSYEPASGDYRAHIHFEFPDGTELRDAFSYDWRFWTMPEARDALRDAGFARIDLYWEQVGADGIHGNGEYRLAEAGANWLSWVAYLACWK